MRKSEIGLLEMNSKLAAEILNQCGEPHSFVNGKQTYLTLLRVNKEPEVWKFLGYCHAGKYEEPQEGVTK